MPFHSRPSVEAAFQKTRGRPKKFGGDTRVVTVRLPEAALAALAEMNEDLSQAIVTAVKQAHPRTIEAPAELAVFGKSAVITVRPTATLEQRADVKLVPMALNRALITFDEPRTVAELELALQDALEDEQLSDADRAVFNGIKRLLKEARKQPGLKLVRRNVIVLEAE